MDLSGDLFQRLEQLNDIGASLSTEHPIDRLLEKILRAAKTITRADGGTLYRMNEAADRLEFVIVRNDTLEIAFGGGSARPLPESFQPLPLRGADGHPNNSMVAVHAALSGKTVNIADAYEAQGYDFSGTRAFDARTGYRSRSFLTVPMKNHEGVVIAVLQLINAVDPATGVVGSFSQTDQSLAESLASQAAVALTNRLLIEQLEALFEAFIKVINIAIDTKSPYTSGHCQRVPILTMMLAEAADRETEGPLAALHLTEKDFYELKIAALLHDCGKITTPVHVVDKATKLETLFDRIALIDTRFELLRAQAEATQWRRIAEGEDARQAREDYAARAASLTEDQAFLRRINIGAERMQDEDIARVQAIAERYRWRDGDGVEHPFLNADELENLSIRGGTLTAAERKIINDHIVTTLRMLEALPWPRHLRNVTEYAGGHHERMDGKGYPKGLTREQMSWQARMMGIADIFEALTACDRPYKKPMSVSQALKVLASMRDEGHIDPDLFEVFLRADIGPRYAAQYLPQSQRV